MTKETADKLPEILKNHLCTLKKVSFDESRGMSMSESLLQVVDFDKIPNEYSRGKGWTSVPNSNDALYVASDNKWFFIEFKNGSIDKANIYRKLYDSIIMLMDIGIIPDYQFVRRNIQYILVYNSDKYTKMPASEARNATFSYILKRANREERLFGIEKFEKYLFDETHTYTVRDFERKFVVPMEALEKTGE